MDGEGAYKTQTTGPLDMLGVLSLGCEAVDFWGHCFDASGAILNFLERLRRGSWKRGVSRIYTKTVGKMRGEGKLVLMGEWHSER